MQSEWPQHPQSAIEIDQEDAGAEVVEIWTQLAERGVSLLLPWSPTACIVKSRQQGSGVPADVRHLNAVRTPARRFANVNTPEDGIQFPPNILVSHQLSTTLQHIVFNAFASTADVVNRYRMWRHTRALRCACCCFSLRTA